MADVEHFRQLHPADENFFFNAVLDFDGRSWSGSWCPQKMYALNAELPRGDFFGGVVGALIMPRQTACQVESFLLDAGELLPLIVEQENEPFSLLNTTVCAAALDADRTVWEPSPLTGQRLSILKYAFIAERLPQSSLFKIPENVRGRLFTLEKTGNPEWEFKARVEARKLKGLVFEKVWTDEF